MLALLLLVSFVTGSNAFVRFEHSILYDESDFVRQSDISVPLSCNAAGCRVYVSMPSDSNAIATKLIVADTRTMRTRFSDIALLKKTDGQKGFYSVKKGNSFVNLLNQNADLKSAPIMLWIVQADAPNIDTVQAYDATLFYRSPARAGLVTIMNTQPYTLTSVTSGEMTVSVTLGGFDSLEECSTALKQSEPSAYKELNLSIRSPLLTLNFDGVGYPSTTVSLSAKIDQPDTFDLSTQMFATSPGYLGCDTYTGDEQEEVSGKTFRSSLYDTVTEYSFVSESLTEVYVYADVDSDQEHSLEIVDNLNEKKLTMSGDTLEVLEFSTNNLSIHWNSNADDANARFIVTLEPIDNEPEPSTASTEKFTTDSTSQIGSTVTTILTSPPTDSTTNNAEEASSKRTTVPTSSTTTTRPLVTSTKQSSTTTSTKLTTTTSYSERGSMLLSMITLLLVLS